MSKPTPWPIFICYRRADGFAAARRLHEMLLGFESTGPESEPILLDAYLDEDMPGVADWQALHGPYLQRARAIVVVCTPGLKLNEGPEDWVHKEIDWWLANRTVAPIVIDALAQGLRYVPDEIKQRWPNIQRLQMVEAGWTGLSARELRAKTDAFRRLIVGAILPSGAAIYVQELENERKRVRDLERALAAAQASTLDARAARRFAESRFVEVRLEAEKRRREGLERELSMLPPPGSHKSSRRVNLEYETAQAGSLLQQLAADAARMRAEGNRDLMSADAAWRQLASADEEGVRAPRSRPDPPAVFSVELLNAGSGESLLIHYGTPDETRIVMVNGGDRFGYKDCVAPRLRQIGESRFAGGPVPVELFIASDQDSQKTEGLLQILQQLAVTPGAGPVELKGIWANIFETAGTGLRPRIIELIESLKVPVNRHFDHMVMRPQKGRVAVTLAGGLEIVVLGPTVRELAELHRMASVKGMREGIAPARLPREQFRELQIQRTPAPLAAPAEADRPEGDFAPNDHAARLAGGRYLDASVSNLASTILLFRFAGKTFLHTGDSRGDLILTGLAATGLLDAEGRAFLDLLHVPHQGSANNVTREFFETVRAGGYLLSGDGAFGNPSIATVASLIAGRGNAPYTMYFVNRDGGVRRRANDAGVQHGKRLDTFFADERAYAPPYRRVFRSNEQGSLIIDLLDPVRY
jgi:hypothetical protein